MAKAAMYSPKPRKSMAGVKGAKRPPVAGSTKRTVGMPKPRTKPAKPKGMTAMRGKVRHEGGS
jgi:hypothetical protein